MKVLFISSEIFPFAKSGGLGDVAASLPKALANYCDITSIMPLYTKIDTKKHNIIPTGLSFDFVVANIHYYFEVYQSQNILFLKDHNNLFNRSEMYGDFEDNDIRFGIFSYAVLEYIKASGLHYDILHINDWQSALIATLAKEHYFLSGKVVFTIHNLAYQGIFSKDSIDRLALKWDYFTPAVMEYHDNINLLKSAIAQSDIVTTVSPTYAKEIQTHQFGCDLENFITDNSYKLEGILNGIDYDEFSPNIDNNILYKYDSGNIEAKKANKRVLLEALFLHDENKPLFIFIGRFTAQKGIDQIIAALHILQYMPINIAILGSGEENYNHLLASISGKYDNVSITIGYDEALARKLYASGDFLYMPSLYEPCGLNQMIAMRYGTIPIVREVGGLKDSVVDINQANQSQTPKGWGVTFQNSDAHAIIDATQRALALYENENRYLECVKYDMNFDYSWHSSAKAYLELYHKLSSGWLPQRMIPTFEIPSGYSIDTLKTIAVNPKTLYTYWEVTPSLVEKYQTNYSDLKLKAFADGICIEETSLYDGNGNYYFYHEIDFKKVWTKIGFYTADGTFTTILSSNYFIAPNSKIIYAENIIWRNLDTDALLHKKFIFSHKYFYESQEYFSSGMLAKQHQRMEQSLKTFDASSTHNISKGAKS